MEQLKLRLGKMKTQEVAEWMGLKYSTFRNNKAKHLQRLKDFCEFESVYGGIIVTQIYKDVYESDIPNHKVVFLREINEANEGLSSISGMSRKLKEMGQKYYRDLSERNIQKKMSQWNYLFGEYDGMNKKETLQGECGSRRWVYAVMLDSFNNYRHLTEEENSLLYHIIKSIVGEQADKIREQMLLDKAFEETNMSKQEYLVKKQRFDEALFGGVHKQFKKETGFILVRIQEYKINGLKIVKEA